MNGRIDYASANLLHARTRRRLLRQKQNVDYDIILIYHALIAA